MSEIKVNKISPRSGTAFTLGDSGDTFTIPSGATINNQGTAVNFGATGSASWITTVKTGDFTAVAGEGYFVNTTGGAIDVTLPAGTAGAVVAISDYANNFATANCKLIQNGSDKIGGSTDNATLVVNGAAITLVFIDATKGWIVTDSGNQSEASELKTYVTATGGTVTCSGNFRIHTFTGPGTFAVSNAGNAGGSNTADYLVVAGGAGGGGSSPGYYSGGGGGAGGYRESPGTASGSYTVSPLGASPAVAIAVPVQSYTITIGAGGGGGTNSSSAPSRTNGSKGTLSTFSSITSAGGGGGGASQFPVSLPNANGGSGGGSGGNTCGPRSSGNTPPVSPPQGQPGGLGPTGTSGRGSGGGGATGTGGDDAFNAPGGTGAATSITNSSVTYSVGGKGGSQPGGTAEVGAANTGNAGQAGNNTSNGGNGGSGIVVIRYKFQN